MGRKPVAQMNEKEREAYERHLQKKREQYGKTRTASQNSNEDAVAVSQNSVCPQQSLPVDKFIITQTEFQQKAIKVAKNTLIPGKIYLVEYRQNEIQCRIRTDDNCIPIAFSNDKDVETYLQSLHPDEYCGFDNGKHDFAYCNFGSTFETTLVVRSKMVNDSDVEQLRFAYLTQLFSMPENKALAVGCLYNDHIFSSANCKWYETHNEEIVRQHIIHQLITSYGYSIEQIDVERPCFVDYKTNGSLRADILIWETVAAKRNHRPPLIVIECKDAKIKLDDKVFHQGRNYAVESGAEYFMLTNGAASKVYQLKRSTFPIAVIRISDLPSNTDKAECLDKQKEDLRTFDLQKRWGLQIGIQTGVMAYRERIIEFVEANGIPFYILDNDMWFHVDDIALWETNNQEKISALRSNFI